MSKSKKNIMYFGYTFSFFIAMIVIILFVQNANIKDFLNDMENRTFDLRQSVLVKSKYKKANKDIVLVTIDDASYEYLLGKYGEWPIPRDVYAKVINRLEVQKPTAIVFDLMFIKSLKSKNSADLALANAIKQNDNVFTSMNFDNQPSDVRKPVDLDKKFTVKVKNDSKIDFSKDLTFTNCRSILPQILDSTKNVGIINISRAKDGIIREVTPFMAYKGDFYPQLSFLVGLKYLEKKEGLKFSEFNITKNKNVHLGKHTLPLTKEGGVILNWYGPAENTFQEVPFYKIVKDINGEQKLNFDFKNKIIYIGTTAVGLSDIKSVPVDKVFPGVELHTTYINNLIDNSFIRKISFPVNLAISIILAVIIGWIVLKTRSIIMAFSSTVLVTVGYIIFTYCAMKFFNLWIAVILPVTFISVMFMVSYLIKYILKSRDFEYQYRLATTDGLTELFNHRYFQEQMIQQVESAKRYNSVFSLILIDIDFFKNFNDLFGHQSGDAVLRQVSQKLKRNVRSTDFVCRYGGEEMSIILPNTDREEAIITAQKICKTIAESPFKLANDKEGKVTISLGVATYPEDGMNPDELIAAADKRLYFAKEHGRNQVGV